MISVICSDAGGAEIISSWLLYKKINFRLTASGPAVKIFKSKFKNIKIYNSLIVSENIDFILFGTSVKQFELKQIKNLKKNKKIKVVVYLDSWTDYLERFKYKNDYLFPDEIWACDKYAKHMAMNIFQDIPIKLIGNYYIKSIRELYRKNKQPVKKNKIVFLSSPIKDFAKIRFNDPNYYKYTEDDILNFFLKDLIGLNLDSSEIIIQIHPRENLNIYDDKLKKYNYNIRVNKTKKLIDTMSDANVVVGCNSMGLVVAQLALGKKTINILPLGVNDIIPFKQIQTITFKQ